MLVQWSRKINDIFKNSFFVVSVAALSLGMMAAPAYSQSRNEAGPNRGGRGAQPPHGGAGPSRPERGGGGDRGPAQPPRGGGSQPPANGGRGGTSNPGGGRGTVPNPGGGRGGGVSNPGGGRGTVPSPGGSRGGVSNPGGGRGAPPSRGGWDRSPGNGNGGHAGPSRPPQRFSPPPRTVTRRDGTRQSVTRGNRTVHYGNDGRTPTRYEHGRVRVDFGRDGSRTFYRGGHLSYRQGYANVGGVRVVQRNYYRGDRQIVRNYYPHNRGAVLYYSYRPTYRPHDYYRYYRNPWTIRVSYPWRWYRDSWFVSFRYYYHPYPYYVGPSYWLTDFCISSYLSRYYYDDVVEQEYEAAVDRAAAANERALAQESLARAAQERAELDAYKEQLRRQVEERLGDIEEGRDVDVDGTLRDADHLYTVSDEIETLSLNGSEACLLSAGDLIRLRRDSSGHPVYPTSTATYAQMEVVTAKAESCEPGSVVAISVSDLAEMENDFSENIDDGLDKMQAVRSSNGSLIP